jgi:hypothetical protein
MPITILDLGPRIVAYRLDGRIEKSDVDRSFEAFDRALAAPDSIRLYAEVESFSGIGVDALLRDFRLGIQRIGALSRIERAAVVSDVDWINRIARIEDHVFRGIDIRIFAPEDAAQARSWVESPA